MYFKIFSINLKGISLLWFYLNFKRLILGLFLLLYRFYYIIYIKDQNCRIVWSPFYATKMYRKLESSLSVMFTHEVWHKGQMRHNTVFDSDIELHPPAAIFRPLLRFVRGTYLHFSVQYNIYSLSCICLCTVRQFVKYVALIVNNCYLNSESV